MECCLFLDEEKVGETLFLLLLLFGFLEEGGVGITGFVVLSLLLVFDFAAPPDDEVRLPAAEDEAD